MEKTDSEVIYDNLGQYSFILHGNLQNQQEREFLENSFIKPSSKSLQQIIESLSPEQKTTIVELLGKVTFHIEERIDRQETPNPLSLKFCYGHLKEIAGILYEQNCKEEPTQKFYNE